MVLALPTSNAFEVHLTIQEILMTRDQSYYARSVRDIFPDARLVTDHRSNFQIVIFLGRPKNRDAEPITLIQLEKLAEVLGTRAISLQPSASEDLMGLNLLSRGELVITVSNVCWPGAESED